MKNGLSKNMVLINFALAVIVIYFRQEYTTGIPGSGESNLASKKARGIKSSHAEN